MKHLSMHPHTVIPFPCRRPPGRQVGLSLHRPVPAQERGPQVQGGNPVHEDAPAQRQARESRQFLRMRSEQQHLREVCACTRPVHNPGGSQTPCSEPGHGELGTHRPRVPCVLDCVVDRKVNSAARCF